MTTIFGDPPPFPKPDFSYKRIRVKMGLLGAAAGGLAASGGGSLLSGGLLSGVGSIVGGLFGGGNKAAKKAANIAASQAWTDRQQAERAYEDQQPYRDIGSAATNRIALLLGLGPLPGVQRRYVPANYNDPFINQTPAPYYGFMPGAPSAGGSGVNESGVPYGDTTAAGRPAGSSTSGGIDAGAIRAGQRAAMELFQTDPGYEFNLSEGLKAIDRGAAARGGLQSGAALKAEQRYGAGIASNEYDNYLKRLFASAGLSSPATTASGQTALGFENLAQGARLAEGNARGSGYAAQANALNSGITNVLASILQARGGGY